MLHEALQYFLEIFLINMPVFHSSADKFLQKLTIVDWMTLFKSLKSPLLELLSEFLPLLVLNGEEEKTI